MRVRWRKWLVVSILFMISVCRPFSADAEETSLVFATDEHKEGGYLVEITREALQRVGYTARVDFMPWTRALDSVMRGRYEALLGAYYTEERAEKMLYTDSIGQTEIVFFKRKDRDIAYSRLEDLKPYRIGMIRGAVITEEFDTADYLQKEETSSPDLNIKKLLAGRVDLIIEQKQVILTFLRTQFPDQANLLETVGPPLKVSKYYNTFSKHSPDHAQKVEDFNRGLQMIRDDGTYQKLVNSLDHP